MDRDDILPASPRMEFAFQERNLVRLPSPPPNRQMFPRTIERFIPTAALNRERFFIPNPRFIRERAPSPEEED